MPIFTGKLLLLVYFQVCSNCDPWTSNGTKEVRERDVQHVHVVALGKSVMYSKNCSGYLAET